MQFQYQYQTEVWMYYIVYLYSAHIPPLPKGSNRCLTHLTDIL